MGNYDKTKHKNIKNRRNTKNVFSKIIEENFPTKEVYVYKDARNLQNIKQINTEKKISSLHNNQDIKHIKQRKNIKSSKEKKPSNT